MLKKELKNKIIELAKVFSLALTLAVFAIIAADLLYSPKKMLKRGYQIEISKDGKVVEKIVEKVDISVLMKTASIENGAKIFKKCATCHNVERGAANKVGPNLFGVVGRAKGSVGGFSYSDAMRAKGGSWVRDDLNQFLEKPKNYVPGTKMGFAGLKKAQDRADIILFLESKR